MKRFALCAGVAVVLTCPAAAQNPPPFHGPFVGAQLGWQHDRRTATSSTVPPTTSRLTRNGLAYGGQLGYDLRLGKIVLGLEAALTGRSGKDGGPTTDFAPGRTWNATTRAGVLINDKSLLYARAGYSKSRIATADPENDAKNRDGYTLGAGYERLLSDRISARLEYAFGDYGRDSRPGIGGPVDLKYQRHGISAGINFRF